MQIIEGKRISQAIREELKAKTEDLRGKGIFPGLATVLVGDNPASKVYVSSKIKACKEIGIQSFSHILPGTTSEKEIIELISTLNNDNRVNGILLQLPLPNNMPSGRCVEAISVKKDADGLHPYSLGRLFSAKTWDGIEKEKLFVPCTPLGIIQLLKRMNIEISGKNAVVVGRSNLVGKPIAMLLMAHNATVTTAHSRTKNLKEVCRRADILVAAIGKDRLINEEYIKEGAAVIDVGINRTDQGLRGDVDFESAKEKAGYITPVPGGVGPMTITMLMNNTILASEK
jgi:methylenetetrahydrofolate dehydrogenase (NADP+)/methenyltetrahydrofolate cyclohydrolase